MLYYYMVGSLYEKGGQFILHRVFPLALRLYFNLDVLYAMCVWCVYVTAVERNREQKGHVANELRQLILTTCALMLPIKKNENPNKTPKMRYDFLRNDLNEAVELSLFLFNSLFSFLTTSQRPFSSSSLSLLISLQFGIFFAFVRDFICIHCLEQHTFPYITYRINER